MRSDKGAAFVLRRQGKSYREIEAELGVAKSTLSNWFSGVDFSTAIRTELTKAAKKKSSKHLQELNRTRGIALEVKYELAKQEALKEMKLYRNVPLFTTALSLYWGEGDTHSKNQVRMASADPQLLQVFGHFLTEICGVEQQRLRLGLFLPAGASEVAAKRYWSKQLGIKNFHKTQMVSARSASDRKAKEYGTCMVLVSNTFLKKKLTTWIDHLPEMVLNTVPKKRGGHG